MILFHTDLDRTLIYSRRVNIKSKKICVENRLGEELSFMTEYGYEMLHKLKEKILIVPTTTRCIRQYNYIDLGYIPKYALLTNGGVLLKDGKLDEKWYKDSLEIVKSADSELKKVNTILDKLDFENKTRTEDDLFLMIQSENPEELASILKENLDLKKVDIFFNNIKAYVMPKGLSKGDAVRRFKEKLTAEDIKIKKSISAGDSDMDIPMLIATDEAFAPSNLFEKYELKNVNELGEGEEFLDTFMKYLEDEARNL